MYNLNELKRTVSIGIVVVAGMLLCLGPLNPLAFAQPLRIGVFPNLHCALIYLADSQGFFKKHGIQVAIKEYESGPTAVNDLMTERSIWCLLPNLSSYCMPSGIRT